MQALIFSTLLLLGGGVGKAVGGGMEVRGVGDGVLSGISTITRPTSLTAAAGFATNVPIGKSVSESVSPVVVAPTSSAIKSVDGSMSIAVLSMPAAVTPSSKSGLATKSLEASLDGPSRFSTLPVNTLGLAGEAPTRFSTLPIHSLDRSRATNDGLPDATIAIAALTSSVMSLNAATSEAVTSTSSSVVNSISAQEASSALISTLGTSNGALTTPIGPVSVHWPNVTTITSGTLTRSSVVTVTDSTVTASTATASTVTAIPTTATTATTSAVATTSSTASTIATSQQSHQQSLTTAVPSQSITLTTTIVSGATRTSTVTLYEVSNPSSLMHHETFAASACTGGVVSVTVTLTPSPVVITRTIYGGNSSAAASSTHAGVNGGSSSVDTSAYAGITGGNGSSANHLAAPTGPANAPGYLSTGFSKENQHSNLFGLACAIGAAVFLL